MPGSIAVNVAKEAGEEHLTVWRARGWTYQEAVLARRRLIFTDTRAVLDCKDEFLHEDNFGRDTPKDLSSDRVQREAFGTYGAYMHHLRNYAARKLSVAADACKASKGILGSLYGRSSSYFGLPRADFDRALLWSMLKFRPDHGRVCKVDDSQRLLFPTWSWAFKSGTSMSSVLTCAMTQYVRPITCWYTSNQADSVRIVVVDEHSSPPLSPDGLIRAVAAREKLLDTILRQSNKQYSARTVIEVDHDLGELWTKFSHSRSLCELPPEPDAQQFRNLREEPSSIIANVQTTSFHVNFSRKASMLLSIKNSEGQRIGKLKEQCMPIFPDETSPFSMVDGQLCEFVALSLSVETTNVVETDSDDPTPSPIWETALLVWVLLIHRRGSLAYRRAVGWIYLRNWVKADRRFETVVLG